jgi:hypothetical protein
VSGLSKRALARLLGRFQPGIVVNEYFEGDGASIYKHACGLGCEGIVSKRLGSPYRGGRRAIGSRSRILTRRQCAGSKRKIRPEGGPRFLRPSVTRSAAMTVSSKSSVLWGAMIRGRIEHSVSRT